jgi:hypothetical protein
MNNNPLSTIKNYFRTGGNPQQLFARFMQQNQNPMVGNLIKMAQNGNTKELENFARNALKEKGKDFDTEFAQFKSQFMK